MESTPPRTNMEPKNDGFFIGISSSRGSFSGSFLVFGGVRPFFFFSWLHLVGVFQKCVPHPWSRKIIEHDVWPRSWGLRRGNPNQNPEPPEN